MTTMTKRPQMINNAGLLEIYRVVLNLYNKGLATKDEIKELSNTLKDLLTDLPDTQEKYLH